MARGEHKAQRQVWVSEECRDKLRELADAEQRDMRVVAERLIAEAHGKLIGKGSGRKGAKRGKGRRS